MTNGFVKQFYFDFEIAPKQLTELTVSFDTVPPPSKNVITGMPDTMTFVASTNPAGGAIVFTVESQPVIDLSNQKITTIGSKALVITTAPKDTAYDVTVTAKSGMATKSSTVRLISKSKLILKETSSVSVMPSGTSDTLVFTVVAKGTDTVNSVKILNAETFKTGEIVLVAKGKDTLSFIFAPVDKKVYTFSIEVIINNKLDTLTYSILVATEASLLLKQGTLTISATEGEVLNMPLVSYLADTTAQLSADKGTVSGKSLAYTVPSGSTKDTVIITVQKNSNISRLKIYLNISKSDTPKFAVTYLGNGNTAGIAPVDTGKYVTGASVTVAASGSLGKTGSTFVGWNTKSDGSGINYNEGSLLSISSTSTILYAKWTQKVTFTLTISTTNGSVTKAPDLTTYDSGTVVTLTPVPANGYHFTGWSGALTGTANPGTITVNEAKSITAEFEKNALNSFTLTVLAANGTVKKTPDLPQYDSGSSVGLKATPGAGYSFVSWSGDATGTADSVTVTMSAAKSVTANFALKKFALNITATNGTVNLVPSGTPYDSGTVVALTPVAAPGYRFTGWSGDLSGAVIPESNTMNSAKNVTANFALVKFALNITAANGSVTNDPNFTMYDSGAVVKLTAVPAAGYEFTGWSGGLMGATNPGSITMDAAKSVTATFALKKFALTVSATNGGSVTKSPDAGQYDSGTVVALTATHAPGYTFTEWSGGLTGTTSSGTVTMNSAKSVMATFTIKKFTLTTSATDGTITRSPVGTQYDSGTVVTLTAAPAGGFTFNGWSGDLSGTTNVGSITMTGPKSVTANFIPTTYKVTYDKNGGTTGTVPVDNNNYTNGSSVTILANPGGIPNFVGWSTINGTTTYACGQRVTITDNITLYAKSSTTTVMDNDGNLYTSISLAGTRWMVQNLKTTKYRNESPIDLVAQGDPWLNHTAGAYCWRQNNISDKEYGAFYNWDAVQTGQLPPAGWRLATEEEWTRLFTDYNPCQIRTADPQYWSYDGCAGSGFFGFNAMQLGALATDGINYPESNSSIYWWISERKFAVSQHSMSTFNRIYNDDPVTGGGIRCVKE